MVISIDLGSNTFRVALMKCAKNGFEILKTFERIVGSARGLAESGAISESAKERITQALKEAASEFDFKNLPCIGVATQAFRTAKNSDEFFDEIAQEFGVYFKIISGNAEARLTFLGVKNALDRLGISYKNFVFVDIGGASSEISDGENFKSFEFGIITFFESFKTPESIKNSADKVVTGAREILRSLKKDFIVLTSGEPTTKAAMKISMNYADYDPKIINASELRFKDFEKMADMLLKTDDKLADAMVGSNRKMPLFAGMVLLQRLLGGQKVKFIVIDDGLREGVGAAYLSGEFDKITSEF
ncbi:MAG: disulfide bond formation protein DsbA [Campylobacter sp.]|nr:disulfide bond formation protein DsbA [Campylobacter sp.]